MCEYINKLGKPNWAPNICYFFTVDADFQRFSLVCFQKRNAAQMTRLKKQLKEVQSRNRHWSEQATALEKNIAQLRAQLN